MAFMRRDVNLGLLILIVVSIIVFSGFSVYYQTTFKGVSLDYQNKLEQLGKVTNELATQRVKLNETFSLRMKAEEDRKALDSRYKDVSDENERLESDKDSLQSEVSSTKSQLAEKSAELDATKNLLSQTQSTLSSIRSERDSLRSKRDRLEDDIKDLCQIIADNGIATPGECG